MTRVISLCLLLLSQISLAATVDPIMSKVLDRELDRELDKVLYKLPDNAQKPMQFDNFTFGKKSASQNVFKVARGCGNPIDKVIWQNEQIYEMQMAGSLFTNLNLSRISKLLTNIRLNAPKSKQVIRRKASFARCKGGCCYPCDVRSRCSSSSSCSRYSL